MKKILVAALAVAAAAFAALPAMASASPSIEATEKHFTVTGGAATLTTAKAKVSCNTVTGTGEFEGNSPYTTGNIELTFHGCEEKEKKIICKSAGQANGTIKTTSLPFHLVTATEGLTKKDGILITPNAGTKKFAEFSCSFLVSIEVEGNGVIGVFTEPTNTTSNELNINFAQRAGEDTQTFRTTCEGGNTEWDLKAKVNGTVEQAVQIGEGTTSLTNGAEGKLL